MGKKLMDRRRPIRYSLLKKVIRILTDDDNWDGISVDSLFEKLQEHAKPEDVQDALQYLFDKKKIVYYKLKIVYTPIQPDRMSNDVREALDIAHLFINAKDFEKKLEHIASLKKDWDSYGADPISPEVIKCASYLYKMASEHFLTKMLPAPDVTPVGDGSLELEWGKFCIIINPNLEIELCLEDYADDDVLFRFKFCYPKEQKAKEALALKRGNAKRKKAITSNLEKATLVGGQKIYAHRKRDCYNEYCSIHNHSDHHMKEWPQNWRSDRGIMERICEHGVGHPDPDDPCEGVDRVHGCDGCCISPDKDK